VRKLLSLNIQIFVCLFPLQNFTYSMILPYFFSRALQNNAVFKVDLLFIFNIIKFYVSSLDYINE